jgi:hypothetical protein
MGRPPQSMDGRAPRCRGARPTTTNDPVARLPIDLEGDRLVLSKASDFFGPVQTVASLAHAVFGRVCSAPAGWMVASAAAEPEGRG